MDPYLETRWSGVHGRPMGYAADALAPQLGDDLAARVEETVHIDREDDARLHRWPDVMVVEQPSDAWARSRPTTGSATLAEPILLADPGPYTERWVKIVDLDGGRVVTAIDFLGPWNKQSAGGGRDTYVQKRREILASDTNLVEVDLVRAGDWPLMIAPFRVQAADQTPYRVTVARVHPRGEACKAIRGCGIGRVSIV